MKIRSFTVRNIADALQRIKDDQFSQTSNEKASRFLQILKLTKPGERENIAIQIIEP